MSVDILLGSTPEKHDNFMIGKGYYKLSCAQIIKTLYDMASIFVS